ncbi:MAG: circularly permuted type 2 ATP-grasp protein, partial [Xanthomonadales bacterium]|nr:circularly permuted type 2 ATP-grasp protein [Xanthomonadales bacterium]
HLPELVVKEAQGSGGYGMLIGPCSSKAEIEAYRRRILDAPERFIAQPTLDLSVVPTFVGDQQQPRHVDLRPFLLCGDKIQLVAGGLTRVAMKEGSLVVNSSQGGGVKDTWVLDR